MRTATLASTLVTTPRAAGFLRTGMLDWPGRLSTTLFLAGCNLRCPYCHNPSLISSHTHSSSATWDAFLTHAEGRRSWIDGVVISGGEPTTDPNLIPLLEELRLRRFDVKLDTNGTNPGILHEVLSRGLVEFVAMDIKTTPSRYEEVTGCPQSGRSVLESVRAIIASGVTHEFRTTCHSASVGLAELPELATLLAGGMSYVLQQFSPTITLDPLAASAHTYTTSDLERAAKVCSSHLPTTLRGV